MFESENFPDNSTNTASTLVAVITTETPTTTSSQKNEEDARMSLQKLPTCHRQFYHRLSHVTNTHTTITSTTDVNDSNITIMAATTSTCTDKKSSSSSSGSSTSTSTSTSATTTNTSTFTTPAHRPNWSMVGDSTVKLKTTLSNSDSDQLNDLPPSTITLTELNDSGKVIDDDGVETAPLSNNGKRVLNSSTDVSECLLTESPSLALAAPLIAGLSVDTKSYQGCTSRYLETEGEATIRRRRRGSKTKPTTVAEATRASAKSANLIGKPKDVSSMDDGFDFPTHTTMDVSFGIGVNSICSGGFTDVENDKRNKKATTTAAATTSTSTSTSTSIVISTTTTTITTPATTTTIQFQSVLPPVNNQNKWPRSEEPNVSCHSSVETSTSSSLLSHTVESPQSCLQFPTVHSSSVDTASVSCQSSARRSLVEQRKRDLFERSQEDTRARSRSRSPITEELQKNSANFPSVNRLVKMYTKLLQDNKQPPTAKDTNSIVTVLTEDLQKKLYLKENEEQLKPSIDPHRNSPLSDEGCTVGQSPYSSDCDEDQDHDTESVKPARKKKEKVARSASSDSALGLEEEPMEPPANLNQGRRMTLTVTDLPLRPALLPLAEPTNLPDSPTTEVQISLNALLTQTAVPSKVLLEERVVEIPEDRFASNSRRESAQSCISDYPISECGGVRFVRTPSVVVSDYSDDLMCGITLEEIEYFRAQRLRRRSSVETSNTEKDDAASDVSAASSCSNLYYCGSTISALDGAECYVNGIRMPIDRKISDCSTCDGSGDEDNQSFVIPEQPEDLKDYITYCTDQMVVQQQQQQQQQQQANRKPKKVGGTLIHNTNTDTCNTNSNSSEP